MSFKPRQLTQQSIDPFANHSISFLFSSASFVGLLIYASIIFHKSRKGTLNTRTAPAGAGMEPYSQPTAYPSYNNQPKSSYDPGEAPGSYNMNNYRQA